MRFVRLIVVNYALVTLSAALVDSVRIARLGCNGAEIQTPSIFSASTMTCARTRPIFLFFLFFFFATSRERKMNAASRSLSASAFASSYGRVTFDGVTHGRRRRGTRYEEEADKIFAREISGAEGRKYYRSSKSIGCYSALAPDEVDDV